MKAKLLIGLAVLGLSIASAKNFDITLDKPTTVGNLQLKPGTYKLTVQGSAVRFTDENGKSVTTNAKIEENSGTKFSNTTVDTRNNKVAEIDLGGTNTKLTFE